MKSIRYFLLVLSTLLSVYAQANDITFKPEKHQKVKSTFSGDIDQESSIHLIVFKDKKTKAYGIKPYYIDKDYKATSFDIVTYDKEPTIISYQLNNTILSIVTSEVLWDGSEDKNLNRKEIATITLLDFNIETKEIIKKEIGKNFKNSTLYFNDHKKTVILHYNKDHIAVQKIIDNNHIDSLKIYFQKEDLERAKGIFKEEFQVVNTAEYVKNGSISSRKGYLYGNSLYFDYYDGKKKKKRNYTTAVINLENDGAAVFNTIPLSEEYKKLYVKTDSYIANNDLFLFCRNVDELLLEIIDIETGKTKYKANLKTDLASHINSERLYNLQKTLSNNFSPTITVNTSVDKNLVIRFDAVLLAEYNYDWSFHHMMWQQQQMMMNQNNFSTPRFGPNPTDYNEDLLFFKKKKEFSIEIVLSPSYQVIENGNTETIKKEFDKKKHMDVISKNKKLKNVSLCGTRDQLRYVSYNKASKTVSIKTGTLN